MNQQESLTNFILDELLMGQLDELAPDENLLMTGLVDSLGVMRLMMFIEEEFGVEVAPADVTIDNFESVATMVSYVEQQKAEKVPA